MVYIKYNQEEGELSFMSDKIIENNQVEIMGKIASPFTFSHQVFGEGFYMVDVLVKRLSDSEDRIPVMISERLLDVTEDYEGEYIHVLGQFRSYNRHEEKKNRLVLSVFAREVEFVEDDDETMKTNAIFLDGYICKPPVYRKTPLGREIADLLIAVNRPYGKSDYIPCIFWGRNARYVGGLKVGELVHVIADAHIYDRHIPIAEDIIKNEQYDAPKFELNPNITDFYQFTTKDIKLVDYKYNDKKYDIEVAI